MMEAYLTRPGVWKLKQTILERQEKSDRQRDSSRSATWKRELIRILKRPLRPTNSNLYFGKGRMW